jgi:hypothetical protein
MARKGLFMRHLSSLVERLGMRLTKRTASSGSGSIVVEAATAWKDETAARSYCRANGSLAD